ncbi:AraC family transcriptional regulator [Rhodobacterales bacterium]|nr:AraC family transcriptional regulator [Rhodobacterales bacterium]
MSDPLAEMVMLLAPEAPFSKLVHCAGPWRVRREGTGQVFYTAVLAGRICLHADGKAPVIVEEGDFAMVPASFGFTVSSVDPVPPADLVFTTAVLEDGTIRHGRREGPPEVQQFVGHCVFGSPDASLLVSLLPDIVVVKGERRLALVAEFLREEARAGRPARDVMLQRLLEVLIIEALRSTRDTATSPGLLAGLTDDRVAPAIRRMHEAPAKAWTVTALAKEAALSRSAFFARFNRVVGTPPMEYLLNWRMTLAKDYLRKDQGTVAEIAERVGYGSASAFSTAFVRHTGHSPARFARGSRTETAEGLSLGSAARREPSSQETLSPA